MDKEKQIWVAIFATDVFVMLHASKGTAKTGWICSQLQQLLLSSGTCGEDFMFQRRVAPRISYSIEDSISRYRPGHA